VHRNQIVAITTLSPIQQGLLFHVLAAPEDGLYVEQALCRLDGDLDVAAFRQTWSFLIGRHAALRTAVLWRGLEQPAQVLYRDVPFDLPYDDLTGAPDTEIDRWDQERLREGRRIGLDLSRPPLMRLGLARTGARQHRLVWSVHHLIHDAWSLSILLNELLSVYEAFTRGRAPALAPAGSYVDFVKWLKHQDSSEAASFWRADLEDAVIPPPFPNRRVPEDTACSQRLAVALDADTQEALDAAGRAAGLTLNTSLVAAWALVLAPPGASEALFGATVSGRPITYPDIDNTVGVFINTLPFRVRLRRDLTVRAWLRELQRHQHRMLDHQSTPLADLKALADVSRERPLFESILVCQNALEQFTGRTMGDVEIAAVSSIGHPHYPLMCRITPGRPMLVEIVFDARRVDPAAADAYLARMCATLAHLPDAMDLPLDDLRRLLTASPREAAQAQRQNAGARLGTIRPKPAASFRHAGSGAQRADDATSMSERSTDEA
jgi:hypothetical protein